jgi:phosphate transport system protein
MSELPKRLDRLILRLDHMGLRVEQALADALHAVRQGDQEQAREVRRQDSVIDRQEVEIERECIRLLALYQPAAIDLRRICFIIKVNNDLERIADLACSIVKRTDHLVDENIKLEEYPLFDQLADMVSESLGRTVRMLSTTDTATARQLIERDESIDDVYAEFVRTALDRERSRDHGVDAAFSLLTVARALERVGDLCTNIAEDIIFLSTGEIIRHGGADPNAADH